MKARVDRSSAGVAMATVLGGGEAAPGHPSLTPFQRTPAGHRHPSPAAPRSCWKRRFSSLKTSSRSGRTRMKAPPAPRADRWHLALAAPPGPGAPRPAPAPAPGEGMWTETGTTYSVIYARCALSLAGGGGGGGDERGRGPVQLQPWPDPPSSLVPSPWRSQRERGL